VFRHGGGPISRDPAADKVLVVVIPVTAALPRFPDRSGGIQVHLDGEFVSPLEPEVELTFLMGIETPRNSFAFLEAYGFIPEGKLHVRHMVYCLKAHAPLEAFTRCHHAPFGWGIHVEGWHRGKNI
jgi:hypothetical protein